MMHKIFKYFMIISLIFTQNFIQTSQATKLANALRLTKALTATKNPSAKKVIIKPTTLIAPNPPLTPAAPPVWNSKGVINTSAPFVATTNSFTGTAINAANPISCQKQGTNQALLNIEVILTDIANTNTLTFTFDWSVCGQSIIQQLATQGLYIAINISGISNQSTAQVALTDAAGNIFASQQSATGTFPAGMIFSYANITFNAGYGYSAGRGLSWFNWLPITAQQQRVIYQQNPLQTAPTVTGQGIYASLTPPVITTKAALPTISAQAPYFRGTQSCTNAAFVTTPNPSVVINSGAGLSCAQPLSSITVALTDFNATGFYTFNFTVTNATQQSMVALGALYVTVNITGTAAAPVATTTISNSAGTVLATSSSTTLPAGTAFAYACIGFNNTTPTVSCPAGSTYANWIPLATQNGVLYQQSANGTASLPSNNFAIFNFSQLPATMQQTTKAASLINQLLAPPSLPFNAQTPVTWLNPGSTASETPTPALATGTFPNIPNPRSWKTIGKDAVNASAPISCQGGLNLIYVELTDATGNNYLQLTFGKNVMANQSIQLLAIQGLYVSIAFVPTGSTKSDGTTATSNVVEAALCDINGNIFAITQTQAYIPIPAIPFMYANIGFNTTTPRTPIANEPAGNVYQVCYNWLPIISALPVLYKQQPSPALTTPLPSANPNASPTIPTTTLTPPNPLLLPKIAPVLSWGNQVQIQTGFIATTATPLQQVQNPINSTALSCSGELNTIFVSLVCFSFGTTTPSNSAIANYVNYIFDSTILPQPYMTQLAQNGLYVVISLQTANRVNTAYVSLCDATGTVWAQQYYLAGDMQLSYANIGFNMPDTTQAPTANQTYFNWLPLANGQSVLYKQATGQVLPTAPYNSFSFQTN
jgi:hypothetical protein